MRRYAKKSVRTTEKPVTSVSEPKSTQEKNDCPPETKPIRGTRRAPPTTPFRPGNQHAFKHGGYAGCLLPPDDRDADARIIGLNDELYWLRVRNLSAATNIGRWSMALEDNPTGEQRKSLMSNISAAEKAMHCKHGKD